MQLSSSSSSSRCSHSQPLLPKTPFQCFLQKYREDCRPAVQSGDEQLVKLQAGKFWRKMSTEQKRPYVQQAKENKRVLITKHTIFILADYDYTKICLHVCTMFNNNPQNVITRGHSGSCSDDYTDEEEEASREYLATSCCCPSQTAARRKCNNVPSSRNNVQKQQNMAYRLIQCLFCNCEDGHYARQILFQCQQKANEFFPHLEDETFFVYYKVLITTLLLIGGFTISLSLWHYLF